MTTPERDSNGDLRDLALDAAWRGASGEAPPPALDAMILAAAHRAVGSKPQGSAARAPWRWWTPLAAAAAIGAVAIGVLQLTPEERDASTATVSDAPRAEQRTAATADTPAQPAPEAVMKDKLAASPASNAPAIPEVKERAAKVVEPAASAVVAPPAAGPASSGKLKRDAPRAAGTARDQDAGAGVADPFPANKRDLLASSAPPVAQVPAERQAATDTKSVTESTAPSRSREMTTSRPDVAPATTSDFAKNAAPAKAAVGASMPESPALAAATAPATAPASAEPQVRAKQAPGAGSTGLVRNEAAAPLQLDARRDNLGAMRANPMPASPSVTGGRSKDEGELKHAQRPAPAAAESTVLAKVQADRARAPDDYIASIRRLLATGENDAAKRELVAFRGAYADADARLPVDLRDWAKVVAR